MNKESFRFAKFESIYGYFWHPKMIRSWTAIGRLLTSSAASTSAGIVETFGLMRLISCPDVNILFRLRRNQRAI